VYLSYLLLFIGGVLGLYRHAAFAVLAPAVLLAAGARWSFPMLRRLGQHVDLARRSARARVSPLERLVRWAVATFGVVCLGLLYLSILTPDNASFDAIYYHMGLAEQYAVRGGIFAPPDGWLVEALPLLASTLYSWAFIFPSNDLFDAMMVCAHMEFVVFLTTLACLPVVVRCLVPRARAAGTWVAMFLFPVLVVYDSGLHSANDHIAAFWALPMWVAAFRGWRRLEPGRLALFAVAAAGALLTKYQCASLVLAPALALLGRAVWLGVRQRSLRAPQSLAVALLVGFVAAAPHWLKNWVWFGDPLFPALHAYLDVHPWYPGAGEIVEWNYRRLMPRPQGTMREQITQILRGSVAYAFKPETGFHRDWPVFGALFTLSLTWLVFLRRTGRLWALAAATQCGICFWYFFAYYERYLLPLVPWMAAVVAGAILLVARRGWPARAGLAALVGLELVWGGDVYFIPHWLMKTSRIGATASLLGTGYRGDLAAREQFRSPHKEIGEALPEEATILLHEHHLRLGLARPVYTDFAGFQTGISYQHMTSAREVYDLYRRLGVTHVVWENQRSARVDSLAGDLRFWQFSSQHTLDHRRFGILTVGKMPSEPPAAPAPDHVDQVAYLSCDEPYAPGRYPLSQLNTHVGDGRYVPPALPAPTDRGELAAFSGDADFLVVGPRCKGKQWPIPKPVFAPFAKVATRRGEELWVRKLGEPSP
jgi:hypothetical protein